ncbi:MAG: helix-turn-helix transcriptional regulator [Pseudomonadota bacterium]
MHILFAERLRQLVDRPGGISALARDSGLDRSALSEFLSPTSTRLPRAEALRRIAEAGDVSVDWLLGLSFAEEGARRLEPLIAIEDVPDGDLESPIARWHREAAGHKIRYVPALLPDQLSLPEFLPTVGAGPGRLEQAEVALETVALGETDLEIAMPVQTVEDLAAGVGLFRGIDASLRCHQLLRMSALAKHHYPALRLHLYNGRTRFAAPFTVFGPLRAALYLGPGYLVLQGAEDVRRMARLFDGLVREAVTGADRVHELLDTLGQRAR